MKEFQYGGQAVLEGVMMRGAEHFAVAVRNPQGAITIHSEPLEGYIYRGFVARTPFVRGLTMLWDTLVLGVRTLMYSADVAVSDQPDVSFSGPVAWGTMAVSLTIGVGLFFLLPVLLVRLVDRYLASSLLSSVVEGVVRLALFVGYLAAVGTMPDIKRVFAYHGAEHKAVNALEAGAPLEPEQVERFSTAHPRCGTGFMLLVLVIFIILSSFLGRPALWLRVLSRLLLIPVVAGVAYEVMKLSARHRTRPIVGLLLAPGLWLQRLTTREPDRSMLEVSIAALRAVVEAEATAPAPATDVSPGLEQAG
ncbi:MAG TPA: DUF1385 domain-containing protein [Anaerolineae bacterium]|nr:DUF1385 domain-containing protein [Anaerolineae bacterium]HOQ99694.1 DUF1385 domain-containing protein [Anaerolineae bacterium]HPL30142.1 DUF1385 domain-containing protein [Anaerolineae bacterium]